MGLVNEAYEGQGTPFQADLDAGVEQLSYVQEITFTKYVRVILPLDGFAFWVKSTLLSQNALMAAGAYGDALPAMEPVTVDAGTLKAKGSFHYVTDVTEEETETSSANRVIFTSETPIQGLNDSNPNVMWIGNFATPLRAADKAINWAGETIRFAFSSRGSFYRQANLYHYVGHAVYNPLTTQIIDDPRDLDTRLIVSNSLPIWLSMNSYIKKEWELFAPPSIPLYPSFLTPLNQNPPFASVHIIPETTRGIAQTPLIGPKGEHSQLCSETVRITFYGMRNEQAMDFVDFVNQFSINTDLIGLMNIPVIRNEKQPQVEFNAIAQRSAIDYEVSYYQEQARNLARQLIKIVFVHYQIGSERLN